MKKVLAIAAGILALAACNREAQVQPARGGEEVRFTTNFNTFTMKAGETSLDKQTVRIFAGAPIGANETGTVEGNGVTLANPIKWNADQTENTSFAAVYPSDHATATLTDYDLQFEGAQNYAYHSGVLVATTKDVAPGNTVALDFKHPFSNVVIKVTNKLEGTPAITGVSISNVPAVGTIDMLAGTSAGGATLATIGATAKEGEAGTYQALIFPGKAKPSITVTTAENSYNFVIASEFTFEANKSYNAAIELNDDTTPVTPGAPVNFTVTVSEWENVAEDLGFEKETPAAQVWSAIGQLNGSDWDKDFEFTETSEGVWEADITYLRGDYFKLRFAGAWDREAGMPDNETTGNYVPADGSAFDLWGSGNKGISFVKPGTYHLKFLPEGYKFYATLTEPEPLGVTVYVDDQSGWDVLYLYTWKDGIGDFCTTWAGDLPKGTKEVGGVTYKVFELGKTYLGESVYVIFNNDNGIQTDNVPYTFKAGVSEVYFKLTADKNVTEVTL